MGTSDTALRPNPPSPDTEARCAVEAFMATLPDCVIRMIEDGRLVLVEFDPVGAFIAVHRPNGKTFTIK